MELTGLHHITAVTGNAAANVKFYTQVLGMRLVKKTVNQDDLTAYHLFYGDETGSAGTEMTFFDWPLAGANVYGTRTIGGSGFRVGSKAALAWWAERLDSEGIQHQGIQRWGDWDVLHFSDPEGQRLFLVNDEGKPGGQPWANSPIPTELAIKGLHSIVLTEASATMTSQVLERVLGFRKVAEQPGFYAPEQQAIVYESGPGGHGTFVIVDVRPDLSPGRVGIGGVHHVAFRTPDQEEQRSWDDRLRQAGLPTSGVVDRYYFQSLYFREPGGILFEIATDGPGFTGDEPVEHLGERLSLPPFLEPRREAIEAGLQPL